MVKKAPSPLMQLRNRRGITQEQLGKALGVSRTAVMTWETGRAIPRLTISQVKALCQILGVTLDELPNNLGPQEEQVGKSPLQQLREHVGLTRDELAKRISISKRTVSIEVIRVWEETGEVPSLSLSQVAILCELLGVTIRELCDYLERPDLTESDKS